MKKTLSVILLTLALGAFAFSQQGGGGGGQGRGQRGGQRGGGYNRAGAQYGLINRSDVAGELKITDDQKTKLASARTDMMTAMQGIGQDATPEERTAARTKATEGYNSAVAGILTADQGKRLLGIFVQMTPKNQALENPDVQSAIGLSSDQTGKIKDLVTKYTAANRGLDPNDAGTPDARAKNLDTLSNDLMGVLTDDQKSKLTALAGEKFTPDPSIRGNGGGGRRGGGAGGGGNRGNGGGN